MTDPGIADRTSRRLEGSPLYQLVKLKLGRMLHGANADSDEMDRGIVLALTVLTLPGAFLSLLLFNKYGSLLRFLRGQIKFDPYASSLSDEYLFIALAMLVSGGVALWKWDMLFLDRRDMVNIVPLPVHTRQIFAAGLAAILLFAMIFCIDVNAASAVLFPLVVSASQESFLFFGKIALGHGVAIVAASMFSFTTVFAVAGVCMAVLSARVFQAISLYLRGLIAIALLLFFASAFTVSRYIAQGAIATHPVLRYLPSMWFLGMCQWARGATNSTFRHFALVALLALLLTIFVGAMAYGLAYKRHFSRMSEMSTPRTRSHLWRVGSTLGRILDRTVLRTPFEQAGFRFVVRTLLRSDRHRAAIAVFAAIGFVAASQLLLGSGLGVEGPTTAQFAASLIVLYCCVLGIRYTFDMPVELNANWTFRFLIAPSLEECAVLAGKTAFLLVLPIIVAISMVFAFRWGVMAALYQWLVLTVLSATLIAGLVLAFRKLPFTCAKAGFQQAALLKILFCMLGVFAFAVLPATIEHWARSNPIRLLVLLPVLALAWWAIYEGRSGQLDIDRQIVFHDSIPGEIELLNLDA